MIYIVHFEHWKETFSELKNSNDEFCRPSLITADWPLWLTQIFYDEHLTPLERVRRWSKLFLIYLYIKILTSYSSNSLKLNKLAKKKLKIKCDYWVSFMSKYEEGFIKSSLINKLIIVT